MVHLFNTEGAFQPPFLFSPGATYYDHSDGLTGVSFLRSGERPPEKTTPRNPMERRMVMKFLERIKYALWLILYGSKYDAKYGVKWRTQNIAINSNIIHCKSMNKIE